MLAAWQEEGITAEVLSATLYPKAQKAFNI